MRRGLCELDGQIVVIDKFDSFSVIGDPGCDGLGAATMSVFAKALVFPDVDFNIIAGDIVPYGSMQLYDNVKEFIETIAPKPVFTLCGNHDTNFFDDYFGQRDYALVNDDVLIVALDNSSRRFGAETLNFCRQALENNARENIIILFHIPPPNSFTDNIMKEDSWAAFRDIYLPYKDKIKYFVCGHVHSFFEDSIDGISLIVTGGGGARLEFVNEKVDKEKERHHIVLFYLDAAGGLKHKYKALEEVKYSKELEDETLTASLRNAFVNECVAHFKYKHYSEAADAMGMKGLSRLLSALSDSEYYHARNHSCVLNELKELKPALKASSEDENYEINTMYKDYMEYAIKKRHALAKYTFWDALNAEKVHKKLLDEALLKYDKGEDVAMANYYTCSSCGFTFRSEEHPKRCPICGAPRDKILKVKDEAIV